MIEYDFQSDHQKSTAIAHGCIGRFILPGIWNKRNRALNDMTFSLLSLEETDRVLEIGFGGGYMLDKMAKIVLDGQVVGIDASREMTVYCQKRFRKKIQTEQLEIHCAAAEKIPFPSESFNKACSVNSIFYWHDIQKGISEIYRILQSDGLFVITFTTAACLGRFHFDANHLFDSDKMKKTLSEGGFRFIHCESHQDKHRTFHCCISKK